jgi:cell fate regulator YaaT (PSP1 superfamily)
VTREYIVRYGAMSNISTFSAGKIEGTLKMGEKVIVKTDRGQEMGEVVSRPEAEEGSQTGNGNFRVLRRATPDDLQKLKEIEEEKTQAEFKFCQKKIKEHDLAMKLANVEHLFGGDKIIFYFLADGRVDFRALVKDLAKEYQTRIELKQIGVRDEARLLADFEHCGRELCCKAFMKNLEPVTMKMAKNQKATLDPAKISGRCGRLMCCLRFEDKTYEELKKNLPRKGTIVVLDSGEKGEVLDYDILRQLVAIETEGKKKLVVGCESIVSQMTPLPRAPGKKKASDDESAADNEADDDEPDGLDSAADNS